MRNGRAPVSLPANQAGWSRTTSMAMSAPEFPAPTRSTGPSRSWRGVAVILRVELQYPCIELAGEGRYPGSLMVAHGNDDVARPDLPGSGRHKERFAVPRQPRDLHAIVHGQLEPAGVRLEKVSHLVFGDERSAGGRKAHPG